MPENQNIYELNMNFSFWFTDLTPFFLTKQHITIASSLISMHIFMRQASNSLSTLVILAHALTQSNKYSHECIIYFQWSNWARGDNWNFCNFTFSRILYLHVNFTSFCIGSFRCTMQSIKCNAKRWEEKKVKWMKSQSISRKENREKN